MSKAMLIMDMPSSCSECDFCEHEDEGWLYCTRCDKTALAFEKPTWCPLREVPSKHEDGHTLKVAIENDCYDDTVQDDAYFEGIDKGYNRCIDEILGGGE